ncbi:hypothetical protein XENOCAPTIV_009771 [Xenoophorus captivus]|uniref:Uncharacterized protein n=1 Tax=Xenoophorus captivus TaxID=1517983 RepID=A0ABV0RS66_9TELE
MQREHQHLLIWLKGKHIEAEGSMAEVEDKIFDFILISHVSVKHIILHSRYSGWVLCRAWSSSNLFSNDLTLPIMINGRDDLNFLLLSLVFVPTLHPRRLLFNSSGIWGCS